MSSSGTGRQKISGFKEDSPSVVTCWKCKYFAVSWDPNHPYACGALGFKSKLLPSIEVIHSSGIICQAFKPKA